MLVDEVQYLELNNKSQKSITKRLNSEISEVRLKLNKEKKVEIKNLKEEIKIWKKRLGNERKKKIKVERNLVKLSQSLDILQTTNLDPNFNHIVPSPESDLSNTSNRNKSQSLDLDPDTSRMNLSHLFCTGSDMSLPSLNTIVPNSNSLDSLASIMCSHVPQCILRDPNPPPPFAPLTSNEFYNPPIPPPNICLLPDEVQSYQIFLSLKNDHSCEECTAGALYNNYHEMVHYPDPGPCGGTSGSPVMSCPNNPNTSIRILANKDPASSKFKKRTFRCDICSDRLLSLSNLIFHRNRKHIEI